LQLNVGCSGWSYDAWINHFYPKRYESKRFLEYYSRVFDYVEIDSTFYSIPKRSMVQRWAAVTPEHFRFTAKFPQVVTHDTRLGGGLDGLKAKATLFDTTIEKDVEEMIEEVMESWVQVADDDFGVQYNSSF
jgi:uncharacterized protein YecE (DUF72 family)